MLSKSDDGRPLPTSSEPVYVVHGRYWHALQDVVQLCVLPKVEDGMSYLMSSGTVYYPIDMMEFHARCRPTAHAA